MTKIALLLAAAVVLLLAVACGGGGGENGPSARGTATPAANASPGPSPTRRPAAPDRLCQIGEEPPASYNVQVTARWKGKDRIAIEGTANLPGGGTPNYWICQDGEVIASLVWARQPTFKNGKIQAESKLVESQTGSPFNADAHFQVVLSILGDPVQVPYFTVSVPVEGKPE